MASPPSLKISFLLQLTDQYSLFDLTFSLSVMNKPNQKAMPKKKFWKKRKSYTPCLSVSGMNLTLDFGINRGKVSSRLSRKHINTPGHALIQFSELQNSGMAVNIRPLYKLCVMFDYT
jgi:hypothetical protein